MRCYGASAPTTPKAPVIKINNNLSLQTAATAGSETTKERPLVLLLSWLAAKQRHLDNFATFYLNRGCDVLTIKSRPMQVRYHARASLQNLVLFLSYHRNRSKRRGLHFVTGFISNGIGTNCCALRNDPFKMMGNGSV